MASAEVARSTDVSHHLPGHTQPIPDGPSKVPPPSNQNLTHSKEFVKKNGDEALQRMKDMLPEGWTREQVELALQPNDGEFLPPEEAEQVYKQGVQEHGHDGNEVASYGELQEKFKVPEEVVSLWTPAMEAAESHLWEKGGLQKFDATTEAVNKLIKVKYPGKETDLFPDKLIKSLAHDIIKHDEKIRSADPKSQLDAQAYLEHSANLIQQVVNMLGMRGMQLESIIPDVQLNVLMTAAKELEWEPVPGAEVPFRSPNHDVHMGDDASDEPPSPTSGATSSTSGQQPGAAPTTTTHPTLASGATRLPDQLVPASGTTPSLAPGQTAPAHSAEVHPPKVDSADVPPIPSPSKGMSCKDRIATTGTIAFVQEMTLGVRLFVNMGTQKVPYHEVFAGSAFGMGKGDSNKLGERARKEVIVQDRDLHLLRDENCDLLDVVYQTVDNMQDRAAKPPGWYLVQYRGTQEFDKESGYDYAIEGKTQWLTKSQFSRMVRPKMVIKRTAQILRSRNDRAIRLRIARERGQHPDDMH
ncbi:MAG: hypothetical protein Q9162_002335 [Coniocarpon cinnabarinum]